MSLQCGVWGIFPDDSLAPIKTSLNIDILDDICFLEVEECNKAFHFSTCLGGCRWCVVDGARDVPLAIAMKLVVPVILESSFPSGT